MMEAKLPLEAVTLVLSELEGHFVFSTRHGDYVVMRKERFDELRISETERQLELPSKKETTDDSEELTDINRSIALERDVEALDDLALADSESTEIPIALPKTGKQVRFEPLRGDLPPELQE